MRVARNHMRDHIYVDARGRRIRRMSFEQRVQLQKRYRAQLPGWRRSMVGYFMSVPLIAAILAVTLYMRSALGSVLFPSSLFIVAVLLLALFWGVGPALFAVLLSAAMLEYWFVGPSDQLGVESWRDILQLGPVILSGLVIALITAQRERARLQALETEQELQTYAEELEETNRKLADANMTKDRFLSVASHELKTPITTIQGQAQLMLRRLSHQQDGKGVDGVERALTRINEQTGRLTVLVDELLDVNSMRSGKAALKLKKADLTVLCRDVVEDQHLLTGREVIFEARGEQPIVMAVDGDRFAQVLTNLVSNAVKYSAEGVPVNVALEKVDGHVMMSVKDRGRGIAKDQQQHIFETFYRTPDAQSSSEHGLGLGLSISKDIVERHGGKIWCESEKGKGSTFYVEFPGA
jgi:signal transduction histidine kinase